MKIIELFRRTVEPKRMISEKYVFKMNGFRFFKKEMTDSTFEFWAYKELTCRSDWYEDKYFLGQWVDKQFVAAHDLREIPWQIQKGATRFQLHMRGLPHSHSTC